MIMGYDWINVTHSAINYETYEIGFYLPLSFSFAFFYACSSVVVAARAIFSPSVDVHRACVPVCVCFFIIIFSVDLVLLTYAFTVRAKVKLN